MFKGKKGIELSINFIVMLILAIAVFAGGLMFAGKFFGKANDIKSAINSQTDQQLEKLLDSGSPVVIPIKKKDIYRKKFDSFALGVLAQFEGNYKIHINLVSAFDKEKKDIKTTVSDLKILIQDLEKGKTLKRNEKWKSLIAFDIPSNAVKGTYIYQVTITLKPTGPNADNVEESLGAGGMYDAPLQLIVVVP